MKNIAQIILASQSKRRSDILKQLKIKHTVMVSDVEEDNDAFCDPWKLVMHHAEHKAKSIAKKNHEAVVIGADTVVVLDNKIYGKPRSMQEAELFFEKFMGREIEVLTGLVVMYKGKMGQGVEKTALRVRSFPMAEARKFLKALDNPLDRAGGFSMEGIESVMFDNINGSYFNVLGLPVGLLYDLCKEVGVHLI